MKQYYFPICFLVILLVSCSGNKEFNVYDKGSDFTGSNGQRETNNLFLNQISKGLQNTEGVTIQMLSYNKNNTIQSDKEKEELIEYITDQENYLIATYDSSDKKFTDIKIFRYSDLNNLGVYNTRELQEIAQHAVPQTKEFLNQQIRQGYSFYNVLWEIKGKKYETIAVFDNQEFVYDNLISNLVTFESEKLNPNNKSTKVSYSTSGDNR